MISGEITEYVGVDRIVAKRLRVPLQTDPAEPTVDVQVQSFRPCQWQFRPRSPLSAPQRQTSLVATRLKRIGRCAGRASYLCVHYVDYLTRELRYIANMTADALKYSKAKKARRLRAMMKEFKAYIDGSGTGQPGLLVLAGYDRI